MQISFNTNARETRDDKGMLLHDLYEHTKDYIDKYVNKSLVKFQFQFQVFRRLKFSLK